MSDARNWVLVLTYQREGDGMDRRHIIRRFTATLEDAPYIGGQLAVLLMRGRPEKLGTRSTAVFPDTVATIEELAAAKEVELQPSESLRGL